MDIQRILRFLHDIAQHNNRNWFQVHKNEYDTCRDIINRLTEQLIIRLSMLDERLAHLRVKDCTYRFNRDTRFSSDKSPYKTHMGIYIASHTKKGLHGGYYLHLEPGQCLLACGTYWLPTHILTACRNEIMGNFEQWASIVEDKVFVNLFGRPGQGSWGDSKGFGLTHLKKCPAGFPNNYEHIEYLRMKDYCCWTHVDDSFFENTQWMEKAMDIFSKGKPMLDFINAVVDDYEE